MEERVRTQVSILKSSQLEDALELETVKRDLAELENQLTRAKAKADVSRKRKKKKAQRRVLELIQCIGLREEEKQSIERRLDATVKKFASVTARTSK